MKYRRTQIYLDPEDHRELRKEAAARGISLAALLREIASAHVREASLPYHVEKGWDAVIGIDDGDEPSDIARYEDEYKREVWEAKAREVEQHAGQVAGRKPRKRRNA